MNERQVYPEWLDTDEDMLAEKISEIEAALPDSYEEFKKLYEEKHRLMEATPAIRSILDADKPAALSKEEAEQLIRIIALDNRMHEITDRAIFVYGRKNAYMFLRSIGII